MSLTTNASRERLLASTVLAGVASLTLAAPSAFAQVSSSPATPPSSPPAAGDSATPPAGQEVVVTGSRIRQPNLTATSPTTVVNHQELVFQGTTNVETLLNNLPSVTASQTEQISNGSSGTAELNLRNLGPQRTLVLVDGKRLEPGDSGSAGAADINNIPAALVDRIDVVTGGASAVYGSDAVAGVVNFIMKKNFEGLRIDAQTSFFNHQNNNKQAKGYLGSAPYLTGAIPEPDDVTADGFTYDVTAILGANSPDDKGNITTYGSYRHLTPVLQSTRDYSSCALTSLDANSNIAPHACNGSSNTAYGRFDNTGPRNATTMRGTASRFDNPDGSKTFVPFSSALGSALSYNFDPVNYLQREDDTYRAGYYAHYKINDKIEVYSDFMFMRDQTDAQIAPSGFFSGVGPNLATGYTFNCNNPLIGPTQAAALCPGSVITPGAPGGDTVTSSIRYRFASAPRNSEITHTDYKIDIGARGDLGQGWHYDAYLQYGTSNLDDYTSNYASDINLQNALNVVTVNGVNRCVTSDTRCQPLDIFSSLGRNFTPGALNYVLVPAFTTGKAVEQVAHADISGDLGQYGVKSPFAGEGLGVALGTEYRREFIQTRYDTEQQQGDLSGGGGQALDVTGAFDVYELFGEARLPLVQNMPFIKDLSIDVGYRYSDYSSAGKTDTYKGEANYSPTQDVRFRFSYNRAVRAPSAVELFTPQVAGLGGYQDPCSGAKPTFTQAQCTSTGLNPALYGLIPPCASAQCEILTGGNPNLKPEVADTYSLGAVFTPRFFRGFSASIDYFNINIQGVIGGGSPPLSVLQNCANGQQSYCALITRDNQGTINSPQGYVQQLNVNAGSLQTRGVDLTANYRLPFSSIPLPYISQAPGALNFDLVTTYTQDLTIQPVPLGGHANCAGLFGPSCGVPQPHWRGSFRTTWVVSSALSVSANVRYIGRSKLDVNETNAVLGGTGFFDSTEGKISGYTYLDLAATYRFKDRYTFRAGVNNVLDKDPPIIDSNGLGISAPPFGNGNTYPGVYDSLGRQIFVGVTADF